MHILSGCDLVEIDRIRQLYKRRPQQFLARIFTSLEQDELMARTDPVPGMAARLAGKEAVAKAIGCGIGKVSWQEIEIIGRPPIVSLLGNAVVLANQIGVKQFSISLSHSRETAMAVVNGISFDDNEG